MSILIDKNTKVLVQGITGKEGAFHTGKMLEYGTNVVAGVTPKKGGTLFEGKIPVFNTVSEAADQFDIDASVIFVPAVHSSSAILESYESGISLIICITEGIPVLDMMNVVNSMNDSRIKLIGPNCPGVISPGKSKIGIMPGEIHKQGNIGVISRSGTLTYEVVYQISELGLGQSTCIGIGGDPIGGLSFIELLKLFAHDHDTKAVVMIGEIGGTKEEEAAEWIKTNFKKPVIGYIAGLTAPPGRRMGHAGAIISGGKGSAKDKIEVMKKNNIIVSDSPATIGRMVFESLNI